jgi:hypothetical protein
MLLSALLLCSVWGVIHPEERWYLITESELQSLEQAWKHSEAERRDWQIQAGALRTQAGSLNGQAASLRAESERLNRLLRQERERNLKLTQFFNEYEAAQSRLISRRDTQIAVLEAENERQGRVIRRLGISSFVVGLLLVLYTVLKLSGKLR